MSLDVKVLDDFGDEVDLKQKFDDDDDIGLGASEVSSEVGHATAGDDEFVDSGYSLEDENGEAIEEDFADEDDGYEDFAVDEE